MKACISWGGSTCCCTSESNASFPGRERMRPVTLSGTSPPTFLAVCWMVRRVFILQHELIVVLESQLPRKIVDLLFVITRQDNQLMILWGSNRYTMSDFSLRPFLLIRCVRYGWCFLCWRARDALRHVPPDPPCRLLDGAWSLYLTEWMNQTVLESPPPPHNCQLIADFYGSK